jgi:hypothetical protein
VGFIVFICGVDEIWVFLELYPVSF